MSTSYFPKPYCTRCKARDIQRVHRGVFERLLSRLFSLYPYRCRRCGWRFLRRSDGGDMD